MKKLLIAAGVLVLGIGVLLAMSFVRQGNDRRALAAYKAQLRAQGEWLTIEDAGFPFALETNASLEAFVILASQLSGKSTIPGTLDYLAIDTQGQLVVAWQAEHPLTSSTPAKNAPTPTWDRLAADCTAAAGILAGVRAQLEHPPRRFGWDYTNLLASVGATKAPWVPMRQAGQFLAADTLVALRAEELPRAQANLRALSRLSLVYRDDLVLVSTMMRTAFTGLGLCLTAQALHANGWDEATLQPLQRDWESVDLIQGWENGMLGERLFAVQAFEEERRSGSQLASRGFAKRGTVGGGLTGLRDQLVNAYWRTHMDRDELFFLHHLQDGLVSARRLRANTPGVAVVEELAAQQTRLDELLASPIRRYQYLISAVAIPNHQRAFQSNLRNETLRRMTITAIALKRFHLRHGAHPRNLEMLVPEFLAEVPIDPWSGEPLLYRLSHDGTTRLYSVGEDGVDDGGDPTPVAGSGKIDFWTGKDVVWPRVVPTAGGELE